MNAGYTTRQAAATVGLAPNRIRHAVKCQWLSPKRGSNGEYRFSFQDMVLLKTFKGLLDADVPSRRIVAALGRLRERQEPQRAKPLSALHMHADGDAVVVREGQTLWNAETGQGHLAFAGRQFGDVKALNRPGTTPLPQPRPAATAPAQPERIDNLDSDDWYNIALDLEDAEPEKALEAYEHALSLNIDNADAHVNLGRLLQVQDDLKRATMHYRLALQAAPRHQLANYNLGTIFDELGELDMALAYYRRASKVPDAHYNLSRIFELRGDELASLRHMRKYKTLMDE